IPLVFSSAVQADEFVLRAFRSDGRAFERTECALWLSRGESRDHDWVYFVDGRVRLLAAANSIRTAGYGFNRGSGCADCPGDCEGIHSDEDFDGLVESCAGAGIAPVFGRSRRIRAGRGSVDVCGGRIRTCAGAWGEDVGGDLRVWIDVRGVPSGAAGGMRRGTGAGDRVGDEGSRD